MNESQIFCVWIAIQFRVIYGLDHSFLLSVQETAQQEHIINCRFDVFTVACICQTATNVHSAA